MKKIATNVFDDFEERIKYLEEQNKLLNTSVQSLASKLVEHCKNSNVHNFNGERNIPLSKLYD